jgi:hypothetical protein
MAGLVPATPIHMTRPLAAMTPADKIARIAALQAEGARC